MEKQVELIIVVQGDSVQASFYPYKTEIANSHEKSTIKWLVRIIWTPDDKVPGDLQVSVQDFAPVSPNTPPSPYGSHSPTFTGQPQPAGEHELIWLVPGAPITSVPPAGEKYEWSYSIIIGNDTQTLHNIDPLVVISG